MSLNWLNWSNPVAIWWGFLLAVSSVNIGLLLALYARPARGGARGKARFWLAEAAALEPLLLLCTVYVLGCAFRSILPRADVQRICLYDTWLSSVLIGRSVATIAELCFVMQWAIVLRVVGELVHSDTAKNVARMIVPLIALAECCSWYAVISTNYLGNVLENSLWTVSFALVGVALFRLATRFRGAPQIVLTAIAAGTAAYVGFMCMVDVPMYFARWQADLADGKIFFGLLSGLHDLASHWVVTRDAAPWRDEIPWMSLYFSLAVWASLGLASFSRFAPLLPRYLARPRGIAGLLAMGARPAG